MKPSRLKILPNDIQKIDSFSWTTQCLFLQKPSIEIDVTFTRIKMQL
jgi:hypothetical protein